VRPEVEAREEVVEVEGPDRDVHDPSSVGSGKHGAPAA
jgi:hypothetical protein